MGAEEMIFELALKEIWVCRCTVILEAIGYDPGDTIPKSNDST